MSVGLQGYKLRIRKVGRKHFVVEQFRFFPGDENIERHEQWCRFRVIYIGKAPLLFGESGKKQKHNQLHRINVDGNGLM